MTAWVILLAGVAIAFYVLFGYPLLLRMVPFKPGPAVRKDLSYSPTVTAIVAVYNGAAQIRAKLETLLGLDYPKERLKIIVVSDGSTDGTELIVEEYAARGVQLIRAPHCGKATALNLAFEKATGELLFFTDVRQPLDAMALRHLAANFADPTVGAVTGELRLLKGEAGEQADMDLYWRYEVWARQKQSRIDSIFTATGCIYAMRRALVKPLLRRYAERRRGAAAARFFQRLPGDFRSRSDRRGLSGRCGHGVPEAFSQPGGVVATLRAIPATVWVEGPDAVPLPFA